VTRDLGRTGRGKRTGLCGLGLAEYPAPGRKVQNVRSVFEETGPQAARPIKRMCCPFDLDGLT